MSQMNTKSNQATHELYMAASEVKKEHLPPKKRYGHFFIEDTVFITKKNIEHQEKRKNILTGVIRHTSCPDHSVVYF